MPVRLNSTGGGSVTLDVPSTASTTTLNLPTGGGTLVGTGAITSSGLTMNTARLLGRTTAASGAVEEISVGTGLTLSAGTLSAGSSNGQLLNVQVFTSSGTYTRTANVTRAVVIAVGGGGGGGGYGGTGGTGGTTSFGSHVSAAGGAGGQFYEGGTGGTGGTGALIAIRGQGGSGGGYAGGGLGIVVGSAAGGGQGGGAGRSSGSASALLTGVAGVRGGGGGGAFTADGGALFTHGAAGGGQGETGIDYITSVGATETVTIGAGGSGGAAGSIGAAGGAGGAGYVIVYEYS